MHVYALTRVHKLHVRCFHSKIGSNWLAIQLSSARAARAECSRTATCTVAMRDWQQTLFLHFMLSTRKQIIENALQGTLYAMLSARSKATALPRRLLLSMVDIIQVAFFAFHFSFQMTGTFASVSLSTGMFGLLSHRAFLIGFAVS